MAWADFEIRTTLERDVLERSIPLVPLAAGSAITRATLDTATDEGQVFATVGDTMGPTPSGCVSMLKLRPLLFGTAWKVWDVLLEECFLQASEQPDQPRGFSIGRKEDLARRSIGAPAFLHQDIWQAVTYTYVGTVQVRNSLVHRRVYTDSTDALVGQDRAGGNLRPVTAAEQEAFVRAALRLSDAAIAQVSDPRTDADLRAHLGTLSNLHGARLSGATTPLASIPVLTVIVDPEADGSGYVLDIPHIKQKNPLSTTPYSDIIVEFRDRPGHNIHGRLEDAPDQVLLINPNQPPGWLR